YYVFNLGKIKCSAPALNAKLPQ
ncbi:hypothetical protein ACOI3T_03570, partial [Acinetobacter baumannii]